MTLYPTISLRGRSIHYPPRFPEDPPYRRIQPGWLYDIGTTAVNFTIEPGVPDIKFYIQVRHPIDIQNARYVLGVRVFQNVCALETMLDWVGMEGPIRAKVLLNWYQRIARMQAQIELESGPLPFWFGKEDNEVGFVKEGNENDDGYDSDQDGEYELIDSDPSNMDTDMNAFIRNHSAVNELQFNQHHQNIIIKPATMVHNFWPLLNRMLVRDMNALRLLMEENCANVNHQINWHFLLYDPCTDVAVMVYLYAMSVWHSRPDPTNDVLNVSVVWSLAIQLRDIMPCQKLLRRLEMGGDADEELALEDC